MLASLNEEISNKTLTLGATKHNTCDYQMNITTLNQQLSNSKFTHGIIDITNENITQAFRQAFR